MINSPETLPRMTPVEYLSYEKDQPVRHELVDGYLYAMTGASDRNEAIADSLLASVLRVHLKGAPFRDYKWDLKIRVADGFFYLDLFVRYSKERGDPYFKTDPVMLAEVLSPGNQRYDRGDKRLAYLSQPSVHEYLLISQDRMQVELFHRKTLGAPERLEKAEDVIQLRSVNFSITLAELYD